MLSSRTPGLSHGLHLLLVLSIAHFSPPNQECPPMHVGFAPHWYLVNKRCMHCVLVFLHILIVNISEHASVFLLLEAAVRRPLLLFLLLNLGRSRFGPP